MHGETVKKLHICLWREECSGHGRFHKPYCGHARHVCSEMYC